MVKTADQQKMASSSSSGGNAAAAMKKKYKGVRMRSWGSWVSEIRAPNQKTRIWLGSYSTPEAAARAYDAALLCLKGAAASASLNFPLHDSSYHIPPSGAALSPKSIQRIAAAAAAANGVAAIPLSPSPSYSPSSSCSASSSPLSEAAGIEDEDYLACIGATNDAPAYDASAHHDPAPAPAVAAIMAQCCWYNFDSPKYNDMLINGGFFDPPLVEDVYEEFGEIRLWNFN